MKDAACVMYLQAPWAADSTASKLRPSLAYVPSTHTHHRTSLYGHGKAMLHGWILIRVQGIWLVLEGG